MFAGYRVDFLYDRIEFAEMRLSLEPGLHLLEADRAVNSGAVGAGRDFETLRATVSIHSSFTSWRATAWPPSPRLPARSVAKPAVRSLRPGASMRQKLPRVRSLRDNWIW